MLSVSVEFHRIIVAVPRRVEKSCLDAAADSEVDWKVDDGCFVICKFIQNRFRIVGRGIVDEEQVRFRKIFAQVCCNRGQRRCFVVAWDDDADSVFPVCAHCSLLFLFSENIARFPAKSNVSVALIAFRVEMKQKICNFMRPELIKNPAVFLETPVIRNGGGGFHAFRNPVLHEPVRIIAEAPRFERKREPHRPVQIYGVFRIETQVRKIFQIIEKECGGVDILINNAGIAWFGLLTDMTDNDWDKILATNLSSVFYCSRAAIPYMVSKKCGKILNISSMWGTVGASCEVAYSATKSGIHGLTRALAKELAPSNIQVNAIACGVIDTEMNGRLNEEERQDLMDEIPSGRFADPEEVAELALKLTDTPAYMTGQIIGIDGGFI